MFDIRRQHPDGTEYAGHRRHDDFANTEQSRHLDRMNRSATAERHQAHVTGISSPLHRHGPDRPCHCDICDLADP